MVAPLKFVPPAGFDYEKVLIFHDVLVTPPGGIISSGRNVNLPFEGCGTLRDYRPEALKSCQGPARAVVVLSQGQAEMFYHFFAEILSRVIWVREQYPELVDSPSTLYHTTCTTEDCNQYAQLVGLKTRYGKSSHLVSGCWKAKLAAWPPSSTECGFPRGAALQKLNRFLYDSMRSADTPLKTGGRPSAVLVRRIPQRDKKPARIVLNHDEVLRAIGVAGWEVTVHDGASLLDAHKQCAMFYQADLVVAPHGAGLTNMLCCRPGTTVIEIKQSDGGFNKSFLNLASELGLPYIGLDTKEPFSLPFFGSGKVNASAVGEAAASVLDQMRERKSEMLAGKAVAGR